jgi:hypothetical protein
MCLLLFFFSFFIQINNNSLSIVNLIFFFSLPLSIRIKRNILHKKRNNNNNYYNILLVRIQLKREEKKLPTHIGLIKLKDYINPF